MTISVAPSVSAEVEQSQNGMLLWLDLETTGLNPEKHVILEVGFALSMLNGAPDKGGTFEITSRIAHQTVDWDQVNDNVRAMHTENGLRELVETSTVTLSEIETSVLTPLDELRQKHPTLDFYLAGSSIHFDRKFIEAYMPKLASKLHYRMLDVSAIAIMFASLGIVHPRLKKNHRVEDDLIASLNQYLKFNKLVAQGLR